MIAAGVLRLIDKEVIEAGIELVDQPGGVDTFKKLARALDQVAVIQHRHAPLGGGVIRQNQPCNREQRQAPLERHQRIEAHPAGFEGGTCGVEAGLKARVSLQDSRCDQILAKFCFSGQKNIMPDVEALAVISDPVCFCQRLPSGFLGLAAMAKNGCGQHMKINRSGDVSQSLALHLAACP